MMTLLVDLDALEAGDPADNDDVFISDIRRMFKSVYEDSEQNRTGAYIKGEVNVKLGRADVTGITELAAKWNGGLCDKLQNLIKALPAPSDWLRNDLVGQLSDAARELADDWSPYTEHGVYAENEFGNAYFKTTLNDTDLASIKENPDSWAIVVIFPE